MSVEARLPQCILGNGECPTTCRLYLVSRDVTDELGHFDGRQTRSWIIFADGANPNRAVPGVSAISSWCQKAPQQPPMLVSRPQEQK